MLERLITWLREPCHDVVPRKTCRCERLPDDLRDDLALVSWLPSGVLRMLAATGDGQTVKFSCPDCGRWLETDHSAHVRPWQPKAAA